MILTVIAVALGLAIGLTQGGSLQRLASTPIRNAWLMLVGLILPALVEQFDVPGATFAVLVAIMAVAAFAITNLHLVGMGVVLLGLTMNLIPVALNGAMPVRGEALVAAGLIDEADVERAEIAGPRRLEEPSDTGAFLGDIIPIRLTKQVVSFGDLVILVGVADIAANLVRRRRKRRTTAGADDQLYLDLSDGPNLSDGPDLSDGPGLPDGMTTANAAHD